jgi:hypothetical protein
MFTFQSLRLLNGPSTLLIRRPEASRTKPSGSSVPARSETAVVWAPYPPPRPPTTNQGTPAPTSPSTTQTSQHTSPSSNRLSRKPPSSHKQEPRIRPTIVTVHTNHPRQAGKLLTDGDGQTPNTVARPRDQFGESYHNEKRPTSLGDLAVNGLLLHETPRSLRIASAFAGNVHPYGDRKPAQIYWFTEENDWTTVWGAKTRVRI